MTANFKTGVLIVVAIAMLAARRDLTTFKKLSNLEQNQALAPKAKLSEYGFFEGKISELSPAANVFPYEVNAPLFSDYAEKARFIYLPEAQQMVYHADQAFEFPTGAVIIKNFFYCTDARSPEKGRRMLETRLLIKADQGWKALEYLWNAEQTDAVLEVAGASFPVSWIDKTGKKQSIEYIAPNLNQCKGCHSYDGRFVPIGITTRQLNREENGENQLLNWQKTTKLALPEGFDPATTTHLTDYRLPSNQSTNHQSTSHQSTNLPAVALAKEGHQSTAARSYLDGNCAHCHNPHGPASTSGMFLEYNQTDLERLGVGKPPVAAGRGSGNRRYGIVPGKPNESILVFRMESDDPGIRMPELGRQLQHREGVELIKAWIREMR